MRAGNLILAPALRSRGLSTVMMVIFVSQSSCRHANWAQNICVNHPVPACICVQALYCAVCLMFSHTVVTSEKSTDKDASMIKRREIQSIGNAC